MPQVKVNSNVSNLTPLDVDQFLLFLLVIPYTRINQEGKRLERKYSLRELHEVSTGTWLLHAAWNWGELVFYFYIASLMDSLFGLWLISLVIGVRMHGLALLGHEGIHNTISKNKKLNDFLASVICTYPILQSLQVYSDFHIGHHRFLGKDGKDPEMQYRKHTPNKWSLPISKIKLVKIILTDLMGIGVWETRHLFTDNENLKLADVLPQILFWLAGYLLFVTFDMAWVPLLWTFSFFTSYWAAFRMRGLVEHLGTNNTNRYSANLLERFVYMPHESWYHYEHHKWPGIPFYNLKHARTLDESITPIKLSEVLVAYGKATSNIISPIR